jgi:hypothetical protein
MSFGAAAAYLERGGMARRTSKSMNPFANRQNQGVGFSDAVCQTGASLMMSGSASAARSANSSAHPEKAKQWTPD